jgi:hypothetical protein
VTGADAVALQRNCATASGWVLVRGVQGHTSTLPSPQGLHGDDAWGMGRARQPHGRTRPRTPPRVAYAVTAPTGQRADADGALVARARLAGALGAGACSTHPCSSQCAARDAGTVAVSPGPHTWPSWATWNGCTTTTVTVSVVAVMTSANP